MARPLRIEVADGWHHVTARGNERRAIYREDGDRQRFVELLGEMAERFGLVVAVYVLMDNHFHLVLRTPLANLSRAVQWLNVSYSSWFNRRHRRSGHLFQGRFKSHLVDAGEWLGELTRYVHLNPVRTRRLGLGKDQRRQAERGGRQASAQWVRQRLGVLRAYRWSSYPAYVGTAAAPSWLAVGDILGRLSVGDDQSRRTWYRDYVEQAVREGLARSPWEGVWENAVLGGKAFMAAIRQKVKAVRGERHRLDRTMAKRPKLEQVRQVVERIKREPWEQFAQRHGDSGRDMFLWLARRGCGVTLVELGAACAGMSDRAVSEAVRRVQRRLPKGGA
jgi:putative transposase